MKPTQYSTENPSSKFANAITQFAESGASDSTIMAIAGHVSRRMLERYSQVQMEAKRTALEALAVSTKTAGYHTNPGTAPAYSA